MTPERPSSKPLIVRKDQAVRVFRFDAPHLGRRPPLHPALSGDRQRPDDEAGEALR